MFGGLKSLLERQSLTKNFNVSLETSVTSQDLVGTSPTTFPVHSIKFGEIWEILYFLDTS